MRNLTKVMALGFFCSSAFAGGVGELPEATTGGWFSQLSVGAAWANAGEDQQFFLNPGVEKRYVAHKEDNSLAVGEIFIGKNIPTNNYGTFQLGIAAATTGNADLQGNIWDDANPLFNNHRYHYKVRSSRVAVKGRLAFENRFFVDPFVSASLGVGFNEAYDFTNTPLIPQAQPNRNFTDNTKTSFAYTLAIGVSKKITGNFEAGLRYEFADWGKSALGRAPGQTLNDGLALSHVRTNGVLFHIGYRTT